MAKELTPLSDPTNAEFIVIDEPKISLAEVEELLRGQVRQPKVDLQLEE